jgi:FSR family fosmidomycin resistance protein-like MFS transporter
MHNAEASALALATGAIALAAFGLVCLPVALAANVLSPWVLGLTLAAYPAAYGLMQVPAGIAVDWLGGRRVLIVAALLMAVGFAVTFLGGWLTLTGRIVSGCGAGLVLTAGFDLIASRARSGITARFSLFVAGWGVGLMTAGLWGLAATGDTVRVLGVVGLPLLAVGLALASMRLTRGASERPPADTRYRLDLSRPAWAAVGALAAASLGNLYVQIGLLSWTAIWLRERGYGAAASSGIPIITFGLGFCAGSAAGAQLRLGAKELFILASAVSASSACVLVASKTLAAAALALIGAGIGSSIYVGPGYAWLRTRVPGELAARAAALTNAIAWLGSALAPAIIALLIDASATAAFLQLAGVAVVGAIASALLTGRAATAAVLTLQAR